MTRQFVFGLLCTAMQAAAAQDVRSRDTTQWLADFAQLKREMTAHYANLEWAVERRGVDLRTLSRQTEDALRTAATEEGARRAFERFVRAEETSDRTSGTGLGLYISRQLAERHGGRVELERSSSGEGSRFVLKLPLTSGL